MKGQYLFSIFLGLVLSLFFSDICYSGILANCDGTCRYHRITVHSQPWTTGTATRYSHLYDDCGIGDVVRTTGSRLGRLTFEIWRWNGSSWIKQLTDTRESLFSLYNQDDPIFGGDEPSVIYPDGPGENCTPSPACDDSEKICQIGKVTDDSGNIVQAFYIQYNDINSYNQDALSVSSLEYKSPSFNFYSNYHVQLSVNVTDSDCVCPSDDSLPTDLWQNYSVVPPGQSTVSQSDAKFDCAQKCFPKGYIYSEGQCICVDDNQGTSSPSSGSDNPADQTASSDATDTSSESQWLEGIKHDLDSVIAQGNQLGDIASNMSGQLETIGNNQGVLNESIQGLGDQLGSGLSDLGQDLEAIGDGISGLGDKLDDIKDNQEEGFELQGDADLPSDNEYDPTVDDVEEDSFEEALGNYISSGIPILSYINGTSLHISNASSSLTLDIWGHSFDFDLAPFASILNTMGYILSGLAVVIAFKIIIRG